jgi:hypothetical protein
MNWFRHAFALDPPGPAEPTEAERPIVDRVCLEVVRRHLTTPALFFLEMSRPLNSLAAAAIHFFTPLLSVLVTGDEHRRFAEFLDRRGSIEHLCRRIEQLECKAEAAEASGVPVVPRSPDDCVVARSPDSVVARSPDRATPSTARSPLPSSADPRPESSGDLRSRAWSGQETIPQHGGQETAPQHE